MVDFLILNYIQQNMPVSHQVGFLSGLKTYGTYKFRIEFNKDAKREYNQVKDEVLDLLRDLKVESNFEFDQGGITYLADLNPEKRSGGQLSAREQPASRSGNNTSLFGFKILAVSAIKCTPKKTITSA